MDKLSTSLTCSLRRSKIMVGTRTNQVWLRFTCWEVLKGLVHTTRSKFNATSRAIQLILKSVGSRINTSASFRNHWPITSTRQNAESKSNQTVSLLHSKRKKIKPGLIWSRRLARRPSLQQVLKTLETCRAKISTRQIPRVVSWIWWRICTKQVMMIWSEQSQRVFQRHAMERKFQEILLALEWEGPHSRCHLLFEPLLLLH